MSNEKMIEKPNIELWNSFLSKLSEGNFEQSYEYGEISKEAFSRTEVIRLAIKNEAESDNYDAVFQGTYSRYMGLGMSLEAMRGPLMQRGSENSLFFIERFIKEIEDCCKKNRIIRIRIWVPDIWGINKIFDRLNYVEVNKLNSYIIDFSNGIEKLWKSIAHNKRRNIRKAGKKGVEIYQSHDYEDFMIFYSMLEEAKKRGDFSIYPFSWYDACWKLYPRDLLRIFLAGWRDKLVSSVFTVSHGDTVYALGAGSLKEGWKARPNDIMHWKVMEWASQNGYNKYHMGLIPEPTPRARGIWRWKREWKGDLGKISVFEKILLPRCKFVLKFKELAESSYNRLQRLR